MRCITSDLVLKGVSGEVVVLVKRLNVSRLVREQRSRKRPFNMLMCWCIGRAAKRGAMFSSSANSGCPPCSGALAVSVSVRNIRGGTNRCDIPFDNDLRWFGKDYEELTRKSREECCDVTTEEPVTVVTDALEDTRLATYINIPTTDSHRPVLTWKRPRFGFFRRWLTLTFCFHHSHTMEALRFLDCLQQEISELSF